MKVNWKVRLRHPAFYAAVVGLLGFILTDAQIIDVGRFEIYAQLISGVLVAGGVIADQTTAGISDSQKALTYDEPKKDGDGQ